MTSNEEPAEVQRGMMGPLIKRMFASQDEWWRPTWPWRKRHRSEGYEMLARFLQWRLQALLWHDATHRMCVLTPPQATPPRGLQTYSYVLPRTVGWIVFYLSRWSRQGSWSGDPPQHLPDLDMHGQRRIMAQQLLSRR